MIKFSKVAIIAGGMLACSVAFAQSGSGSGSAGTGVDILIGATISANNPGISLPGSSEASGPYSDSGVGRGIVSLDCATSNTCSDKDKK